jgi:hypothetical protein
VDRRGRCRICGVASVLSDALSAPLGAEHLHISLRLAHDCHRCGRETSRATRILPITYRTAGDDAWVPGRVLNLSESGVAFAPTVLEVGKSIEGEFLDTDASRLDRAGQITLRAQGCATSPAGVAAMHFEECRFLLQS